MPKSVRFEETPVEVKYYELTEEERGSKRVHWKLIKHKITHIMSLEQLTEQLKSEYKYHI